MTEYKPYYVKRTPKPGYFTLKEIKAMAVPGRRPNQGGGYEYKAGLPPD